MGSVRNFLDGGFRERRWFKLFSEDLWPYQRGGHHHPKSYPWGGDALAPTSRRAVLRLGAEYRMLWPGSGAYFHAKRSENVLPNARLWLEKLGLKRKTDHFPATIWQLPTGQLQRKLHDNSARKKPLKTLGVTISVRQKPGEYFPEWPSEWCSYHLMKINHFSQIGMPKKNGIIGVLLRRLWEKNNTQCND